MSILKTSFEILVQKHLNYRYENTLSYIYTYICVCVCVCVYIYIFLIENQIHPCCILQNCYLLLPQRCPEPKKLTYSNAFRPDNRLREGGSLILLRGRVERILTPEFLLMRFQEK